MDEELLSRALRRAERLCSERGVRFTEQRRRVFAIVCEADRPIGAYEILDAMRIRVRHPAPPTVYRALDFLLEQGLVHKLETLHAFVGCTHPEHPHAGQFLICTDCGDVTELEDDSISHSLRRVADESGFEMKRRVVEVIGTCVNCAHKASVPG